MVFKKEKLHFDYQNPPYFNEREIWWCSVGENIGYEINGKNDYFRRPVLIIRKLSNESFLAVPLTTKEKFGSWYVNIVIGERNNTVIVSQIRNYDYRRLDKKMFVLDEFDFDRVMSAVEYILFYKK